MISISKSVWHLAYAAFLVGAAAAHGNGPPPLSAYGELPSVEDMDLSHDGKRIAALTEIAGKRAVVMLDDQARLVRMFEVDKEKIRSIQWIGNDRLLVINTRTEDLPRELYTVDQTEVSLATVLPVAEDAEPFWVFGGQRSIFDAVLGFHGQRNTDAGWMGYFGGAEFNSSHGGLPSLQPSLYAVDMTKNEIRRVAPRAGPNKYADWILASDGTLAATFTIELTKGDWEIEGPRGNLIAKGTAPRADAGLVALGAAGTSVIYQVIDREANKTRRFEVPLDGSSAPVEFLPAVEIDRFYIDQATGRMLGYRGAGQKGEFHFFAPDHQAAMRKIRRAFPQPDMRMVDWTSDLARVLVRVSGTGDSGTWYVVNVAELNAHAIGLERRTILPEQVGPISTIAYRAGDGLALDGILTLPPGREAKGLPVVVLPHGGPHSHDIEAFDWWAQAFASRGYAVFQPNFRGSTNRDLAFEHAGHAEWGRKMQSDISDGLAELVRSGIADPKRACIVGASYGGYAALAGVTLQQGLYRCAVSVAGIGDVSMMFRTENSQSRNWGMLKRSLLEELGPRSGFDEISPRRFAARADAPILLIHGRDDTVVPFEQSTRMADALKDAGKPHRLVELREEDHWLSRPETRLQMLEEAVAFVQQHNPAD
jgi:dipeptidyl aminopeptidase/acylaminoacyl peptidase